LDNFAALVGGHVAEANDPMLRSGTRRAHIENLSLNRQFVAWPHCIGPPQFIHTETDCALGEI
jgi:hypothetical protein